MFEPLFMRLALVASIATAASLSVIGVYLIIRRVVFFGFVLANLATVGAAVAQVVGWAPEVPSLAAAGRTQPRRRRRSSFLRRRPEEAPTRSICCSATC
jgi:hypothetical protein